MPYEFDIAVLLATRGRTTVLERSVHSLYECASDPDAIQILFAFDRDDTVGREFFSQSIQPWLEHNDIAYRAMLFDPLGYVRLHVYNNQMAPHTDASWLVIWNDDAVMETHGWDREILRHQDHFKLLAFHTHRDHPYSIFPILPRKWFELLGYLSPHPSQDAWLSQQAYMLDIWERIPVHVTHDRYDLTGNNDDSTFRNRSVLEGRPDDPNDFHSMQQMDLRHRDCAKLATYLKNVCAQDMTFFENIFKGIQDPWEKLARNDINQQMVQFANPHAHFASQPDQDSDSVK